MQLPANISWKDGRIHGVGALALCLVTLAAYVVQIHPLLNQRAEFAAQTAALTDARQRAANLERSLAAARKTLAITQDAMTAGKLMLEPPSMLNDRIIRLGELAADHKLQIDAVEPGKTDMLARYGTTSFRIGGRGTYADIARFLSDMREAMKDTSVTRLQLSAAGAPGRPAAFSMELQWYTAPAAQPVASGN